MEIKGQEKAMSRSLEQPMSLKFVEKTHNLVQLPPILLTRTLQHYLLEQLARLRIRLDCAFKILRIVQ